MGSGHFIKTGACPQATVSTAILTHLQRELPVLRLVIVAKGIWGFAIRDLVVAEPHTNLLQLARKLPALQTVGWQASQQIDL